MASVSRRSFLAGTAALALTRRAEAGEELVLSNARLLVGDGTELRGGVRVRDGVITEVGPTVTGGVDMAGGVLWPGIYDGGTSLGLWEIDQEAGTRDELETSDAITPHARVVDAYNPRSQVIPVARLGGVLGALVMPGTGTLVPGQAAWMRTLGDTVQDTALTESAGVVFTLGAGAEGESPGSPKSRMGVAMKLRDLFDANPPPPPAAEGAKPKKGAEPPKPPTGLQLALHRVLRRETRALFLAQRASDIDLMLDLVESYQLDAMLVGGAEAHLLASRLALAKIPVLFGPVTTQPDGWDTLNARYDAAARLHLAGVRFAFRSGSTHNNRTLNEEAGIAVGYGLPYGAAIAALSGNAPSWWGLKVGQLKPGYEGSLVWSDGDPLQALTRTLGIWMRGSAVPLRSRQTELFERYKSLK